MVNVRNVRGGTGLDPISAEVDEVLDAIFENARRTSEDFFAAFAKDPQPIILAEWLATRAWREIDYVFLLNEEIRRYGLLFERKHITLLAKQAFQEAEHYEAVSNAVESLGGTAPTSVPADSMRWSEFLWECLDRHPLAAVAAWNASETSATGSLEPTFVAGERHGFDEVVRVHRKIAVDEKFHVGLGRQILARYAETDDDRNEILRAMRGMHDIAVDMFSPQSATRLLAT
ncbi:hypothetical protein CQY20_12760 [Mycolicibacterium agri]|uniref:Ferritin-like domain-containing protein n=1 Tax=Mycolicibacterium agri TaxID=36811 RepID=A0A2A7N556_MYCAG|nr:hypothetical protein [Mycolicibacterium agri]PEG38568.1 hypothetical protein CQY20_12760 [Mycolicibacterium agri]GFG53571.1 hypothetical protein MAGR_50120 [Mycolicibacterium agri]